MLAIWQALSDAGVSVGLTEEGRLRAFPASAVTPEIKNLIAANREAIMAELSCGSAISKRREQEQTTPPLTDAERSAVLSWLRFIDETHQPVIDDVLNACESDLQARRYYLARALAEVPKPGHDDRRSCGQCARLASSGRCRAPLIEGADLPIGLMMRADLPKRCAGFKPLANDPDQRPARERWPGLR